MSVDLKPSQTEERGLDHLLTAYLFDSLSKEGRRKVEERLASDPVARAELKELQATLELVEDTLRADDDSEPEAYSFEKRRMERVLVASRKRSPSRIPSRRLLLGIAALMLGLVSLATLYLQLGGYSPQVEMVASDGREHPPRATSRGVIINEFSERRSGSAAPTEEYEDGEALPPPSPPGASAARRPMVNDAIGIGGGAAGAYGSQSGRASAPAKKETESPPGPFAGKAQAVGDEESLAEETLEFKPQEQAEGQDRLRKIAPRVPRPGRDLSKAKKPSSIGKTIILPPLEKNIGQDLPGKGREGPQDKRLLGERAEKEETRYLKKSSQKAIAASKQAETLKRRQVFEQSDVRDLLSQVEGATKTKESRKPGLNQAKKAVDSRMIQPKTIAEKVVVIQLDGKSNSGAGIAAEAKKDDSLSLTFDEPGDLDSSFDDSSLPLNETEGDIGFTDDDFSFSDDGEETDPDLLGQLAGETTLSRNIPAQSRGLNNGNYRLNIARQDGKLVPLGNDADNQRYQSQETQAESPARQVVKGPKFPTAEAQQAQQLEESLVVNEDTLNTFSYYRNLDKRLSFEQFSSRSLVIPPPAIGDEGLGEKGFRKKYGVHPFVATSRDHLSTFGMDVDNAAWGRTRELLKTGELPLIEVVRVEEFVNNFTDPRPGKADSVFTVFTEGGPAPFGGNELELLQITIKSRELLHEERKNAVLTFAIDTSGSMASEEKIHLLKTNLKMLVKNLGPNDRVAIIAFSTNAFVVLPHTSVRQRAHIEAAIDSLSPDGGTNVEAGIKLAYRLAGENHDRRAANRVILCSDGVANLGAKGPDAILEQIRRYAEANLVSLFTYAFGSGGRQAVQGDRMLQRLADEGDGRYQYVDASGSAQGIFSLPDRLQFLASEAKIQVDFNPEVISHYRLLGYEKRDIADIDFRNDKIDAGEVGPGSTVTALYEIKRSRPIGSLGVVRLRYRDETSRRFEEFDFNLPTGVLAGRIEDTSDRFRFIAAIAEFAEILRLSYYARDGSYGAILQLMGSNSPAFRSRPAWREAHDLINIAQGLSAIETLQILESQEDIDQ